MAPPRRHLTGQQEDNRRERPPDIGGAPCQHSASGPGPPGWLMTRRYTLGSPTAAGSSWTGRTRATLGRTGRSGPEPPDAPTVARPEAHRDPDSVLVGADHAGQAPHQGTGTPPPTSPMIPEEVNPVPAKENLNVAGQPRRKSWMSAHSWLCYSAFGITEPTDRVFVRLAPAAGRTSVLVNGYRR